MNEKVVYPGKLIKNIKALLRAHVKFPAGNLELSHCIISRLLSDLRNHPWLYICALWDEQCPVYHLSVPCGEGTLSENNYLKDVVPNVNLLI